MIALTDFDRNLSALIGALPTAAAVCEDTFEFHDISQVLDSRGIAVRAGHHCAKPAHRRFGVQSSTRMSSYLYTTPAEIDALVEGLEYTKKYFKVG
jgi:selenocysteine lyase/cysteine desulfurase